MSGIVWARFCSSSLSGMMTVVVRRYSLIIKRKEEEEKNSLTPKRCNLGPFTSSLLFSKIAVMVICIVHHKKKLAEYKRKHTWGSRRFLSPRPSSPPVRHPVVVFVGVWRPWWVFAAILVVVVDEHWVGGSWSSSCVNWWVWWHWHVKLNLHVTRHTWVKLDLSFYIVTTTSAHYGHHTATITTPGRWTRGLNWAGGSRRRCILFFFFLSTKWFFSTRIRVRELRRRWRATTMA